MTFDPCFHISSQIFYMTVQVMHSLCHSSMVHSHCLRFLYYKNCVFYVPVGQASDSLNHYMKAFSNFEYETMSSVFFAICFSMDAEWRMF